tara:strand:+ start:351 stop:692 length:342 start_codon:yes stop_codon:yes gene_type:complete
MIVRFKDRWFAPSETEIGQDKRHTSGVLYQKGVQEVEDWMKDYLPKSAEILDALPPPAPISEVVDTLRDFDMVRHASDEMAKFAEQEEPTEAEAPMKKARKAKAKQYQEKLAN